MAVSFTIVCAPCGSRTEGWKVGGRGRLGGNGRGRDEGRAMSRGWVKVRCGEEGLASAITAPCSSVGHSVLTSCMSTGREGAGGGLEGHVVGGWDEGGREGGGVLGTEGCCDSLTGGRSTTGRSG